MIDGIDSKRTLDQVGGRAEGCPTFFVCEHPLKLHLLCALGARQVTVGVLWVVTLSLHLLIDLLACRQVGSALSLQELFKPFAEKLAVDEVLRNAEGLNFEQVLTEVRL